MFYMTYLMLFTYSHTCTHAHDLTPQGHEDGEENSSRVVKEVRRSGRAAGRAEAPEITRAVAQGTHGEIKTFVAHLLTEKNDEKKKPQKRVDNRDQCHVKPGKLNRARTLRRRRQTRTKTKTWGFCAAAPDWVLCLCYNVGCLK